nr:MAG: DNA pilot protein [Microvirus sp.]
MAYGAIAEAIAGLITGGVDAGINIDQNTRNIHFQRGANRYNKVMALVQMAREDSAVQRRVADLRKAGLSPTLAAGSAAQSSPPQKIEPIKSNMDVDSQNKMMNMINMVNQTKLANAQQENMIASTAKINQQRELELLNNPDKMNLIKAKTAKDFAEARIRDKEDKIFDEIGLGPRSSLYGGISRDTIQLWNKFIGNPTKENFDQLGGLLKSAFKGASNLYKKYNK